MIILKYISNMVLKHKAFISAVLINIILLVIVLRLHGKEMPLIHS